ncbi:MAG TPA: sigma-70 family RNA polymerase sigma factor [Mycobacteriales bacterium]|nr:sigma-70 family RNA polymerase sigma factor [Mycobacteriales bacterium]
MTFPGSTPDALAAAVHGDERGFAVLYREVAPPLLRYLRVVVGADAEDVAAEVWLEVARDIRSFRGDAGAFRAWVFTVGRHRGIDLLRRRGRRSVVTLAETPECASPDDTEASALDAISTATALAVISRLPRDQAEAVMLRVVAGLDVAEVARILGKRPGAVRVNTLRGLRRLKDLLPVTSAHEV